LKKAIYPSAALLVVVLILLPLAFRGWTPDETGPDGRLQVVSLSPSVTEIVFALDAGDLLVGVTDRCCYPPEAAKVERVGAFGNPNMEKLLALSPDLVIGTGRERRDAAAVLGRSGVRFLWVKAGSVSEVLDTVHEIGGALGKSAKAAEVVACMQAELDAVTAEYGRLPADQRPRVFAEVWHDPITTAGKSSFIDDLIWRAGGINVAHEIDSPYPVVNPEKVVEWNPDVIVLGYMNEVQTPEDLPERIGWKEIKAVRSGRIIDDISSDLLLRPGPRLTEGVRALAQGIHAKSRETP
jgi:iron complex transport system substrate-binding protein